MTRSMPCTAGVGGGGSRSGAGLLVRKGGSRRRAARLPEDGARGAARPAIWPGLGRVGVLTFRGRQPAARDGDVFVVHERNLASFSDP